MQEKKFAKSFRSVKIIQLCILLLIDILALLILICNPEMGKQIYSNQILSILCVTIWVLMIVSLIFLAYDFFKLKSFATASHALNKMAYLDQLTSIPNRHGIDKLFKMYDSPESLTQAGCFVGTITNLRTVNDTYGHPVGDEMILDFCNIFEEIGDKFGFVGRNGGNEFIMVINPCNHDSMNHFITSLNSTIEQYNKSHTQAPIDIKYAYSLNIEEQAQTFSRLLTVTYNKLHS